MCENAVKSKLYISESFIWIVAHTILPTVPNLFLEHCFCTNWARFRFYPTKIPPFEREFHAEFENEGPGASFFDFDVVFDYFVLKKNDLLRKNSGAQARLNFFFVGKPTVGGPMGPFWLK